MKKITRIFALALAFVMAFALQAPVNAAEKAAEDNVIVWELSQKEMDIIKSLI